MLRVINNLNNGQGCYFITLHTVDLVDVFIRPVYKQVIVHTLNHFIEAKGLTVHAWCLMSNHLYLIAQPNEGYEITDIEKEYRFFTALKILEALDTEPEVRRSWMLQRFESVGSKPNSLKHASVWQHNIAPVFIDLNNTDTVMEYFQLVHDKPVKDRCVDLAMDYSYSSARDYAGLKGLVNVSKLIDIEAQLAAAESLHDNFFVRHIRN